MLPDFAVAASNPVLLPLLKFLRVRQGFLASAWAADGSIVAVLVAVDRVRHGFHVAVGSGMLSCSDRLVSLSLIVGGEIDGGATVFFVLAMFLFAIGLTFRTVDKGRIHATDHS